MVLNITRDIFFLKVKLNLLNMSIFLVISFKGEEFVFRFGRVKDWEDHTRRLSSDDLIDLHESVYSGVNWPS